MFRGCKQVVTEALPSLSRPTKSVLPSYNFQQLRSTVIVKRRYEPGLSKIGNNPKIRPRHLIYDFCERVHSKPLPPIQCILTENVDGIGVEGELITISRSEFRNYLYPSKKAVYASPENIAEYKSIAEENIGKPKVTKFSIATSLRLSQLYLPVPMSGDNQWTLNEDHIRIALRKVGVEAELKTITLPDPSITKPQEFQFQISVMGADPITVDGHIYLVYKDPTKNIPASDLPPVWKLKVDEPEESDADPLETEGSDVSASDASASDASASDALASDALASDALASDASSSGDVPSVDKEGSPSSETVDSSNKIVNEDPQDPDKK